MGAEAHGKRGPSCWTDSLAARRIPCDDAAAMQVGREHKRLTLDPRHQRLRRSKGAWMCDENLKKTRGPELQHGAVGRAKTGAHLGFGLQRAERIAGELVGKIPV